MEHQLTGIDLRESALEQARSRFPRAKFIPGNAEELPFPDGSFDVVAMFTVLSSVLAVDSRTAIAREAMRVLRPGGTVLCYDMRFRNPWNHHVRPVTRGKLRHLFPNVVLQLRSVTLLPQVARPLGSLVPCAFPALYAIPLLRTHWLGVLRKPATS
jgi:ubiquinone/menaquinone biosynthesis C-methylase UbiE